MSGLPDYSAIGPPPFYQAPTHTASRAAPTPGTKTTTLSATYTHFVKYAEDFFMNPQYASAFTAAEYLIPHFMEALTPYFAEPDHSSSLTFHNSLRNSIISELRFRAKLPVQPRVPWSQQRGWALWFGDQVKLVALYLAYKVEVGQAACPYDEGFMEHLAQLSEKGYRLREDLRAGTLGVLEGRDLVSV
jgi:hypothetical protein